MLKAVIIGLSGHYGYAIKSIKQGAPCEITAVSPGPEGYIDKGAAKAVNVAMFDEYKKMLDEHKPDIAIINPQFNNIAECAAEAIKRDINIFCDKPISTTLEGLESIKKAVEQKETRICAMMGMRHESAFSTLKNIIEDELLGDIRLIHAQKSYKLGSRPSFYKRRETYGGTIPWVGSHPIDMIYWLSGRKKFKNVSALHSIKSNDNHGELEASAAMLFEMEDEIISTVNIDYLRPESSKSHGDDRIRIVGDKNWAEVIAGNLYIGGTKESSLNPEGNIFTDFCNELSGGLSCSITNQDSIYVTKICLDAREAADNHMSKLIVE